MCSRHQRMAVSFKQTGFLLLGLVLNHIRVLDGQCTYASISTSLNTCTSVASGTSNTKWMFPYGTIAQQATFCQSSVQTNLSICIQGVIWPCMSDAKVTKTFGTNGTNLIDAFSALCSNSLITDAQACMSTITPISTYTTTETTYTSAVDGLSSGTAASYIELCGLITTLRYVAETTLLTPSCTTPTHLAVWNAYFDDVINAYVCAQFVSDANKVDASIWLLVGVVVLVVFKDKIV